PVLTLQKPQASVQVSPISMNVACFFSQHSPILGHAASSQTVCKPFARTIARVSSYPLEIGAFTRIHSGFFNAGASARRAFSGWRGLLLVWRTMVMEAPELTYGRCTSGASRTTCKSARPTGAGARPRHVRRGCAHGVARVANSHNYRLQRTATCSHRHAVVMTVGWPVAAAEAIFF